MNPSASLYNSRKSALGTLVYRLLECASVRPLYFSRLCAVYSARYYSHRPYQTISRVLKYVSEGFERILYC
jgi:hypothetical protein